MALESPVALSAPVLPRHPAAWPLPHPEAQRPAPQRKVTLQSPRHGWDPQMPLPMVLQPRPSGAGLACRKRSGDRNAATRSAICQPAYSKISRRRPASVFNSATSSVVSLSGLAIVVRIGGLELRFRSGGHRVPSASACHRCRHPVWPNFRTLAILWPRNPRHPWVHREQSKISF